MQQGVQTDVTCNIKHPTMVCLFAQGFRELLILSKRATCIYCFNTPFISNSGQNLKNDQENEYC